MGVGDVLSLLSSVIAVATAIVAARDQYRKNPAAFWKSLQLFGVYAAYVFVGLGILLVSLSGPQPPGGWNGRAFHLELDNLRHALADASHTPLSATTGVDRQMVVANRLRIRGGNRG